MEIAVMVIAVMEIAVMEIAVMEIAVMEIAVMEIAVIEIAVMAIAVMAIAEAIGIVPANRFLPPRVSRRVRVTGKRGRVREIVIFRDLPVIAANGIRHTGIRSDGGFDPFSGFQAAGLGGPDYATAAGTGVNAAHGSIPIN
jgi:hypothetical protein